jgi:hypothetical protein
MREYNKCKSSLAWMCLVIYYQGELSRVSVVYDSRPQ